MIFQRQRIPATGRVNQEACSLRGTEGWKTLMGVCLALSQERLLMVVKGMVDVKVGVPTQARPPVIQGLTGSEVDRKALKFKSRA